MSKHKLVIYSFHLHSYLGGGMMASITAAVQSIDLNSDLIRIRRNKDPFIH